MAKRFLLGVRGYREAERLNEVFGKLIDVTYPGATVTGRNFGGIILLPLSPSRSESDKEHWEEWRDYLKTKLAKGAQLEVL